MKTDHFQSSKVCVEISVLFRSFYLQPKWNSSIGRCRESSYYPQVDLANSGQKPNMRYYSLIIFLYLGYALKRFFLIFFPKPPILINFQFFNFSFRCLAKFRQKKKRLVEITSYLFACHPFVLVVNLLLFIIATKDILPVTTYNEDCNCLNIVE